MIIKTFTADWENFDDTLRRDLILDALDRAGRFPLVGTGAFYRDSQSGVANYQALHDAGVTESGFLELSIAYGMVGATFLLLSCLTAACAHRERPNFRAVAVAAMTGSLALTNPLGSLLGSLFFFCCMIWIQCDEPDAERRQYRRSAMLADRARGLAV